MGLQLKASREVSPGTEIKINSEAGSSPAQQPPSTSCAASYGASTMGITIQPRQPGPAAAHSDDDDSMGDVSPSRSPSPVREAAQGGAQQQPASVSGAAATALPVPQAVVTPHRVTMLRGGPVAGSYIDGRCGCAGLGYNCVQRSALA